MPATNCNKVANVSSIPYAIESLIISLLFSSSVALFLYWSMKENVLGAGADS